jgi:hypothetical protein
MRFLELAGASILVLTLAACGRSEDTALRERVAALEKALEAQRQEVAQVRKAMVLPESFVAAEVRARSFAVVDENDKTRAGLRVTKGGPGLTLYDENGKDRARLAVDGPGPELRLLDENGKTRAALGVTKDGPVLGLADENGKSRAALTALKDGPRLGLWDENGNPRAGMSAFKDGPVLVLFDEDGEARAVIGNAALETIKTGDTTRTAESSVVLFDKEGKVIWQAP